MRYVYEGPGPADDGDGGLVRPLDVREFDGDPPWGLWRRLAEDDAQQPPEPPSALPPPPRHPAAEPDAQDPAQLAATGTEG
jgi:hypothetical protein